MQKIGSWRLSIGRQFRDCILALESLAKGGRADQVGLFGGSLTLPLPAIGVREVTVVGSPKDLRDMLKLTTDGKLAPTPITFSAMSDASTGLMRSEGGKVTGRIVLKADLV